MDSSVNIKNEVKALNPFQKAFSLFLFRQKRVPRTSPYLRDSVDLKRFILTVLIAALPVSLYSIYLFGWYALAMICTAFVFGLLTELFLALILKKQINEGAIVTCLLYTLTLPPTVPLWMVALGIVVGLTIGKLIFGGLGKNIFNPALVGRCFLQMSFPVAMTQQWLLPIKGEWGGFLTWTGLVDAQTQATPLWLLKNEGTVSSLNDLVFGKIPGCLGETSALWILVGGLALILTRVVSWTTVLWAFIGVFTFLSMEHGVQALLQPDVLSVVFAGGLLFGIFFMATDPVTGPIAKKSKWIYGFGIGFLSLLIRSKSSYLEGVMFAILIMNVLAPLIDSFILPIWYRKRIPSK